MTFNRQTEPGLIHVVAFQGQQSGGTFTVNLGVYVREVDQLFDDWWGRSKKTGKPGEDGGVLEYVCWLRARLGAIRHGGRDGWWRYSDVRDAVGDVGSRLTGDALPAFSEVSNRKELIRWWRDRASQKFRWKIEPRTPLGFALLMKQVGAIAEARAVVDDVCRSTRGVPFHSMVSVLAEDLGFDCEDS